MDSSLRTGGQNSEDMLTTKEPSKDLGKLKFGRATTFVFLITNSGPTPIKIDKLVVGCGSCTKAQITKTNIEPNEEVPINVTFTPGSTGQQTKHITVRYDETEVLKLSFTAEVHA